MTQASNSITLFQEIIDRINVGIFVVNKNYEIVLWNNYMENYSQKKSSTVVGQNLFKKFPDLPESWLTQKIRNVFILKNFSFTSWEHRPYLFKFLHNRPITGGIDYMRQNATFLPIKGESDDIEYVCITLLDVTDTSIYEGMLKNAVRSLAEASNRDGLTNVYNRRFLEQTMTREFSRIKRYGGTLSFIIIDLDHFKNINDTYGHLAGDEILKMTSQRINECLRAADILARYGGEEFAVLLPETPLGGGKILANRLCEHIASHPIKFDNFEITVTASLGVAEFHENLESHEELIGQADSVLYKSKENGRNQVTIYHPHTSEDELLDSKPAIAEIAECSSYDKEQADADLEDVNDVIHQTITEQNNTDTSEKIEVENTETNSDADTPEATELGEATSHVESESQMVEVTTTAGEDVYISVEKIAQSLAKNEEPSEQNHIEESVIASITEDHKEEPPDKTAKTEEATPQEHNAVTITDETAAASIDHTEKEPDTNTASHDELPIKGKIRYITIGTH